MTLEILTDVEQGSDAWHDARRGIVTASIVGKLITPTLKVADNDTSRTTTLQLIAERITGYTEPTYVSADMERGNLDEPIARDVYSEHIAPVTEIGFMVEDKWGFKIGYSPDGLVGECGLIEIKSRRQKTQLKTILADEVPPENMAQCQTGLLITGREWLDYVSFCGGMPLYVKRVYPDPRWHEAIIEAVDLFEMAALAMTSIYNERTINLPATERPSSLDVELRL